MSTSKSAAPRSSVPIGRAGPVALVRRIATNLLRFLVVLTHSPRARPPRWKSGALTAIAAAVAVIVASMFFLDTAASAWARHLPHGLVDFADQITNFGLGGKFLYPLGFILLCLAAIITPSLPRRTQGTLAALAARFGFLFVAIGLPGLFTTTIKRLIGRARPYVGVQDDPFAYMPFIWRPEYASMPSGHATTATAAAIAIGAIWPRARAVMWLYALIIMLTRVVINVHHPSDVIAGALVGVIGALLVRRWFAARRLVFSPEYLRVYPWPSFERLRTALRDVVSGPQRTNDQFL
ncbi:MAG: phosphatase PAP2 family protein [Xanthobacteraceae bacterium]|nr:phosphatase PAP2 family protein [Xanthobacteraceae bacterium]